MFSPSLSQFLLLALLTSNAFAAPSQPQSRSPSSSSSGGLSMNLHRRARTVKTAEEWEAWAKNNREAVALKYGGGSSSVSKRSSGTNLLVNQNADSSFYGSLAIGTPAVSYDVILDTGSADLWVADSDCTGCGDVPTFDSSSSSSFKNLSTPFSITYGSGAAAGQLAQDTIQMAGFSVEQQIFAVCDRISSGLLTSPVSGLLGLGFQTIASSGATPFWQSLVEGGAWDDPLMAFQLTRYLDDTQAEELEYGGSFTMGFLNSSLYTGDIDYNDIPAGMETYWIQQISSLTSQGSSISFSSNQYAAIDTGTTLVGGPADVISEIYAQIEGSEPGSGSYEGYYTYPCDTNVNITMAFGGRSWSISNADFQVAQLSRSSCLGAFFEIDTGTTSPAWIVGDTFLKNVFTVFRYDPASVGFAELSQVASAMNGADDLDVPSATIGSVAAGVTATSRANSGSRSVTFEGFGLMFSLDRFSFDCAVSV
ncbi:aspartic peptidase A1 [Dendrothele bispora CBS 962.96]|uniref:Aspartic peptidase A1 n=1 Tax=Dendrothele bispora (strain CBS 962.96) TaxID=1314807 RepID=A0A4S8LW76_DENBC|nr:aspartic peptidase A1 [Dendrothele bispora CBS 962.96]